MCRINKNRVKHESAAWPLTFEFLHTRVLSKYYPKINSYDVFKKRKINQIPS